jgi:hypothetical protein
MFGLTALELAKIQFGFTISAHIIIPATTNLFAGQAIRRSHLDQIPRCPARGTPRRSKYVRWRAYAQHRACYGSFERFRVCRERVVPNQGLPNQGMWRPNQHDVRINLRRIELFALSDLGWRW